MTASAEVTPARDVPPVGAEQAWPVPDALLGGLDVASLAAGATAGRGRRRGAGGPAA